MKAKQWYEIAVSWKDDGGTQTIECRDNLSQAIDYAKKVVNDKTLEDWEEDGREAYKEIDFIFIDKWYTPDLIDNHRYKDFEAIIIKNRNYESK